MKILIVEDEQGLRENMLTYLSEDNNICESSATLADAVAKLASYNYDFVLLDIGLPDGEGFELLNYLKKEMRGEAVIIISARNSLDDRIKGLNIGADDYLVKPFHLAELKARIVAVFRRKATNSNNNLIFNEIVINLIGRTVFINDVEIILTRKEYDMLLYFIANKGKVIAKTALAEHLWGDEMDMHDNFDFIYSHIKNLRKKILDVTTNDYLKSIYGIGYKFTDR
ncbi:MULTISPECIES: response regulator transcription factor [unclassified Mucilaginibacter]|uniref:response regulator transcription factor n=1 Tax=unclassified Mucilaginibacter TaxID=2617802 RepID=UPI002AC8BF55|nr:MULTISPECIES: response regulator transcription factor [unclassified Mucilaginibacter]MEB0260347.1 response regulator transcription factor [Mucilaginibacter sp. 10I4]MEB0279386.1 response regulator transcription factor [Mucilaginibacter sp. 10B2]MEB0300513.1 response regulator transcription factor [Mucilaginibacter sp. 5C4]WPX21759.1 response regulator transcription factor [Mucilaginibacter sp. 5C4]